MALRLRVVSDHRRLLGERSTIVFDASGGTIGRSSDNDWVLPDPLRYVSARHARISFRQGAWILEDTSTNGVYVNDSQQPVGRQNACRLRDGDVLRIGEYHIAVAIEADASTGLTDAVPTRIEVLQGIGGRAAQTDLGAALNLEDLLMVDPSPSDSFGPVNAYGQAVRTVPRQSAPEPTFPAAAEPEDEEILDEESVARRIEKLARAASRARDLKPGAAPGAAAEIHNGLQAFCRGAGIDVERLPAEAQTRFLLLAGQLFRESLVGFKDLERTRHEIRHRFGISLPDDPDDPRPSLLRSSVDDLLVEVLTQHESRRLDAVQWLREAVGAAKAHETATAEAVRAAFLEFLDRLDPNELEARFERAVRRAKATGDGRSLYWDLFADFYRNLTESAGSDLPHAFVEAFRNAYLGALNRTR